MLEFNGVTGLSLVVLTLKVYFSAIPYSIQCNEFPTILRYFHAASSYYTQNGFDLEFTVSVDLGIMWLAVTHYREVSRSKSR